MALMVLQGYKLKLRYHLNAVIYRLLYYYRLRDFRVPSCSGHRLAVKRRCTSLPVFSINFNSFLPPPPVFPRWFLPLVTPGLSRERHKYRPSFFGNTNANHIYLSNYSWSLSLHFSFLVRKFQSNRLLFVLYFIRFSFLSSFVFSSKTWWIFASKIASIHVENSTDFTKPSQTIKWN